MRPISLVPWLREGDPSIRWQVLRDLAVAAQPDIDATRRLVATEGWGARLLAAQDPDGHWAWGLYSPKWTSTTYSLLLLVWWDCHPVIHRHSPVAGRCGTAHGSTTAA